jgi:hypothetical protein
MRGRCLPFNLTMANKFFQDLLQADIKTLMTESFAIDKINHEGIKGNVREYGLGRLLSKYLPHEWKVGRGQIHDYQGNQSAETDLIIHNKNIIPPILFGEQLGLYPLESSYYSIEVKTKSTAREIKTTINKFNSLQKLNPINNQYVTRRVYFALSSDLKNKMTELERYKKYDPNFYNNPAIMIICVLGQGYWYYNQGTKPDGVLYGYWQFNKPAIDNFEIGFLLGGIINTLNGNKPAFGYYILPDGKMSIVDEAPI